MGGIFYQKPGKTANDYLNNPEISSRITGIFSSTITAIINIFVILVVGLYGAYDPKLYTENF
jgi:hypothetical protein